jgi:tetratricopeptide (TPR) repeat protein
MLDPVPTGPVPEQATPDGFVARAELLADLGRYDEAAAELGHAVELDPEHVPALTLLSRVLLAADRDAEALTAAERALAVAPADVGALIARGMALAELERRAEAAEMAEEILRLGPTDAYAQSSAAAILAEVRNGQRALNAAWRGVELAPERAAGHLVLGLVAARMELFELAERAYREALRLDPELAAARHDLGLLHLERRRYHEALEHLTAAAAMAPAESRGPAAIGDGLRRMLQIGAGYLIVAAILGACTGGGLRASGAQGWRVLAVTMAVIGFAGIAITWARMPAQPRALLPDLLRADRSLAVAAGAVLVGLVCILAFAAVGGPAPLVAAIAAGFVAEAAVLRGYWLPSR